MRTWLCTDHYIPASFYWETSALKLQRVRTIAPWQSSSCALWLVQQITPQQRSVKNEQYVCFLNVYIRSGCYRIIFRHQGGEEACNYKHRVRHWFAWDCYKFAHCLKNYHPVEYRLCKWKVNEVEILLAGKLPASDPAEVDLILRISFFAANLSIIFLQFRLKVPSIPEYHAFQEPIMFWFSWIEL